MPVNTWQLIASSTGIYAIITIEPNLATIIFSKVHVIVYKILVHSYKVFWRFLHFLKFETFQVYLNIHVFRTDTLPFQNNLGILIQKLFVGKRIEPNAPVQGPVHYRFPHPVAAYRH